MRGRDWVHRGSLGEDIFVHFSAIVTEKFRKLEEVAAMVQAQRHRWQPSPRTLDNLPRATVAGSVSSMAPACDTSSARHFPDLYLKLAIGRNGSLSAS